MELLQIPFSSLGASGPLVLAIGNFDGFHLGHQAILHRLLEEKAKHQARAALLTFSPHPKEILQPHQPFRHIYDQESKRMFLEEAGLDLCILLDFTKEFSELTAQQFIQGLFAQLEVKSLLVGYDFNFGSDREGNAQLLEKEAQARGIEFEQIKAIKLEGLTLSSTMIRRLLFEGDFKRVEKYLGRRWAIRGKVTKGRHVGHELGFPTVNIEPSVLYPLRKGVYACRIFWDQHNHAGVCNVGTRPTFGGEELTVEGHIFDFEGDLYGKTLQISPLAFIREETKFDNPQALVAQINHDVKTARKILEKRG